MAGYVYRGKTRSELPLQREWELYLARNRRAHEAYLTERWIPDRADQSGCVCCGGMIEERTGFHYGMPFNERRLWKQRLHRIARARDLDLLAQTLDTQSATAA